MNIRPSLKRYFFVMVLLAGVATISIMSIISLNYFLMGIDFSMVGAMRAQAFQHSVSNGHPINLNNLTIASQWDDLPDPIRERLNEQDIEEGKLLKSVDGNPFFAKPKAGYFVISETRNNKTQFISIILSGGPHQQPHVRPPKRQGNMLPYIILIALFASALFSLVPYFILRSVTIPVEKLIVWAKQLHNKDQLLQAVPDFHYRELNYLANIVQSSLHSVQAGLLREQRFLAYASHELRTPIAVARTNSELLRKMMIKEISIEKQQQVVDRIERACLTMADLTETLLWLNRQPDNSMPLKSCSLGQLTKQLLNDLAYLYSTKAVEVHIETDQHCYLLPEALCRIILTNLIRNALQHTQEGVVNISQLKNRLIISNQNINTNQPLNTHQSDDALGFGLGLELTQRLVQHYGWQYKNIANSNGHYVEIEFSINH